MGDFGTLLPLAIGYIVVCGMNPAGFLVMMGLTNIALALVYRLPMPLEPKKVVATVAISQKWNPSLVYASGFGLGIIWLIFAVTGLIEKVAKITPKCVTRGIQLALGVLLAIQGYKMISTGWLVGIISLFIVLILRENKYAPAAIVLMILGVSIIGFKGDLLKVIDLGISFPPITLFTFKEIYRSFILAGLVQIPLTMTNAIIATAALIREYFPDKVVSEKRLGMNMGMMNILVPFFGGMPMCHGAGGLAGQYYFGARTGGTNILEGLIEISLGLFLSKSILSLFSVFPISIIGAMMFLVGIELTKFVKDVRGKDIVIMLLTALISVLINMAVGFVVGVLLYRLTHSAK